MFTHLLLVLPLRSETGLYASPGLQEGLSLGNFCWVMRKDPRQVDTQVHKDVGHDLNHTVTGTGVRERRVDLSNVCDRLILATGLSM